MLAIKYKISARKLDIYQLKISRSLKYAISKDAKSKFWIYKTLNLI